MSGPRNDPATFPLEFVAILIVVVLCMIAYIRFLKKGLITDTYLYLAFDTSFTLFFIIFSVLYIRSYFLILVLFLIYTIYGWLYIAQFKKPLSSDKVDKLKELSNAKKKIYLIGFVIRDILNIVLLCIYLYSGSYLLQGMCGLPIYIFYILVYLLWIYRNFRGQLHHLLSKKKA